MKINEITTSPAMTIPGDPLRFRVGVAVNNNGEAGHVVEKINYHPANKVFNKGLESNQGCYAVYFAGIPERRLIMEVAVTSLEVVKETASAAAAAPTQVSSEAAVELPS